MAAAEAITPELTEALLTSRRAELATKKVADFEQLAQIGGKDPTAADVQDAQGGLARHGCNGRIYTFKVKGGGCGGAKLVLKVCINLNPDVPPEENFAPEYRLQLDPAKLPPHRNITPVFSHFIDLCSSGGVSPLPNWDLLDDYVCQRTSFITMPFFPRDLQHAMQSERNAGNRILPARARRIICDILSAVVHLQAHQIYHGDLKPDNVLLQNVGTDHELAVVTDFGCSKELAGYDGMRIPCTPGMTKGGSVMAQAPEIHNTPAGPQQYLDYSANDQFCAGLIGHEIMAGESDHPFPGCDDPKTYRDDLYVDVEPELYDEVLRQTVRELVRVDPRQRMPAIQALEELKKPLPAPPAPQAPADEWKPWPGPLQGEWNPLYENVKNMCLFGDAVEWVEAHPEARDYRSGGVTGWTMLHQAAYWMIGRGLLERFRDVGASPLLLAQNYQQMQDGAGTFTPLDITKENESKDERLKWQKLYADVFALGAVNAGTRGGGVPLWQAEPEPAAELGPVPAVPAPNPAGVWKHCQCQSGNILTASSAQKGASLSVQPKRVPADPRQMWKLNEHGHLICQAGEFCVDIDGRNAAEFANLIMWDVKLPHPQYPLATNQLWVHAAGGTCTNAPLLCTLRSIPR